MSEELQFVRICYDRIEKKRGIMPSMCPYSSPRYHLTPIYHAQVLLEAVNTGGFH